MANRSIQQVIKDSGVAFGTSGARGLVVDLTDPVCIAYVTAFLNIICKRFSFERIALGIDLRPSSPRIAAACYQAIKIAGFDIDYCGPLPTPALAYYAQQAKIPAIMVTGSHIPFDRNGIKFYRPDGEISKEDEQSMLALQDPLPTLTDFVALPAANDQAMACYQQRYLDIFPTGLLTGFKVGVYEHSSVARDCLRSILEKLGAEVMGLERSDEFVPIDTEAVSADDAQKGLDWSRQYAFDAIISTDGDGDRPLISDENGHWLRGDLVGLITARFLGVKALAVPVNCNTAIELCAGFDAIERTRIGSPYVIEGMQHLGKLNLPTAGFEGNGGFLAGKNLKINQQTLVALATRDAVLPILAVLAAAKARAITISALLKDLPSRYTASNRLQNIPNSKTQALLAAWQKDAAPLCFLLDPALPKPQLNETDGLRFCFANGEIIHLRASGNAPELRCYTECASEERAVSLNATVLKLIAEIVI